MLAPAEEQVSAPSLAAAATGSANLLWGGLVIFLVCGTDAVARSCCAASVPRTAMAGCVLLLAGVAVTFGAIATTGAAAFLAGTAVAGAGFGLGFSGSFRMTASLAILVAVAAGILLFRRGAQPIHLRRGSQVVLRRR
jgi:hypothetical protein